MQTIYKYPLKTIEDEQTISLNKGYEILYAGMDPSNKLCLWAKVDTDAPKVKRTVYILGTGNPMPSEDENSYVEMDYIGSVKDNTRALAVFMWHIFVGK